MPTMFTTVPMNEELLRLIREDVMGYDMRLWDVLAATRGPDNEMIGPVKEATTCVIRYYFLGKPMYSSSVHGAIIRQDCKKALDVRLELLTDNSKHAERVGQHFLYHAQRAFIALGLKWDEVNS